MPGLPHSCLRYGLLRQENMRLRCDMQNFYFSVYVILAVFSLEGRGGKHKQIQRREGYDVIIVRERPDNTESNFVSISVRHNADNTVSMCSRPEVRTATLG